MQLHSLTLTAIGPFPGTHTIDFCTLSAGGLFLLEGPTGAGKSTIIDAVVFALYGEPASSASSRDRITSRHAVPGTRPVVDLVFETSAGVHRVRRSPEHLRPKQRGTGLTKEQAQVRLWRLADPGDQAGHSLSTRVGEADAEILRIIGLSREQFVQTVVLPQGEFATFLRATPEERRAVLQRLFGTEIYQRMQERLVDSARTARRRAEAARTEARGAVHAFLRAAAPANPLAGSAVAPEGAGAALEPLPERLEQIAAMAEEPQRATLIDVAADVCAMFEAAAADLVRAEQRAHEVEDTRREAAERERALGERLGARSRLLAEQKDLEERRPSVADVERRLRAARRAQAVAPAIQLATTATAAAERARCDTEALRSEIEDGPDADITAPGVCLTDVKARAERELGALEAALVIEQALFERREALAVAREAVAGTADAHERLATELADRPAGRERLETGLAALRERAGRAEAAAVRLEHAQRVLLAAEQAEALAPDATAAHALVSQRAEVARTALEHEAELRRRRIADIAGELSENLLPGAPCPVCGGADHPAPARRPPDAVTAVDLEAAEQARVAAEEQLSGARTAAQDVAARLHGARETSQGGSAQSAREEVARLRATLADAEQAVAGVAAAERSLVEFDARTSSARRELGELAQAVAAAREALAAQERDLLRDERSVAQARDGRETVAARSASLAERAERAEQLGAAVQSAAAAQARERDQADILRTALVDASFTTADEAIAAALDDVAAQRLDDHLREYDAVCARVASGLAAPAIAALSGEEQVDVAGAESALAGAVASRLATTRAAERARAALATVRAAAELLAEQLAAAAAATSAAEPVVRMAELAAAGEGNDRHHTLATFVLLRRFDEVVAAANLRLAVMSDGRYALCRTDDREGGVVARRTGLGLVVDDLLVGGRRAARTLSGGETFYVSLCLALGLADVVRAEAGGIDLGTLFIDEGFGSLDAETLDVVMRELGQLRSGGRVVGIVSHVAELKRRVAERVEVRRRPDGTSTLAVVA